MKKLNSLMYCIPAFLVLIVICMIPSVIRSQREAWDSIESAKQSAYEARQSAITSSSFSIDAKEALAMPQIGTPIIGNAIKFQHGENLFLGFFLGFPKYCYFDQADDGKPPFNPMQCNTTQMQLVSLDTETEEKLNMILISHKQGSVSVKLGENSWGVFRHPPVSCTNGNGETVKCPVFEPESDDQKFDLILKRKKD